MRLMLTKGLLLPASSPRLLRSAGFGVDRFDDADGAGETKRLGGTARRHGG